MRDNSNDKTLERNYIQKWQFLISEYELVKAKKHPQFRFVQDFYNFHDTSRQTFAEVLQPLPAVRGRRGAAAAEARTQMEEPPDSAFHRKQGAGAASQGYQPLRDPYAILKPTAQRAHACTIHGSTPSARRNGLNRVSKPMQQSKRKIIKSRAGELGHLDTHSCRDLVVGSTERRYLVALVDACTRLAWAEVVTDIKSLSVMFATLKCINLLNAEYGVRFEAVLTDNGPEMASPKNTEGHPMERMLMELGIKHRYTRPYRPQTNGKVERFWRTLNEDLLEETTFESVSAERRTGAVPAHYNTYRPHQALPSPLETLITHFPVILSTIYLTHHSREKTSPP